jgi:hypothetical protein
MDFSTTRWRKSSRSSETNTCVEVALAGATVGVRDSKNPTGPIITLPADSMASLLRAV